MMKLPIIALCLILPASSIAAAPAEDECKFDQQERARYMQEVQKKYPHSHYDEKEYALEIARGKETVTLSIGGCTHDGVMIELRTSDIASYDGEELLMAAVLDLVRDYAQEKLDHDRLQALLAAKQWNRPEQGIYFLNLEGFKVTQIYWHLEEDILVLGIYSYN